MGAVPAERVVTAEDVEGAVERQGLDREVDGRIDVLVDLEEALSQAVQLDRYGGRRPGAGERTGRQSRRS